jgi:class 3 adenylate cyclase/tetratricopeptide (TPR) repeat protein
VSGQTCERCGELLPPGARFCPNCGFPVAAPPIAERKIVTVIFTDLVGSTRLSSQLDPELYREVLGAYYQVVTEELEAFEGRAYNFAGDAVVGVFGIPQAHDDDAVRAIRAGLAIAERIGRVGERLRLPVPLRCRVGVNTGPVAIGSEAAERGLLFGAVVNAAARLQQAATPGGVLVGRTTWILSNEHVEFGEQIDIEAKGFEDALPAWPVLGLSAGSARRAIPLVDRRRELRLLNETFERAVEARRGHMVSLLGEPGIGKSRVAEEFLSRLPESARVLTGRANRFEEDVTFAPLGQVLLQQLGERPDAPPERIRASLEELVNRCCPENEQHDVLVRLGYALGFGDDAGGEHRYQVAEIRSALLALLEGLAQAGPIVLVFEDLHLAEPALLDLVEQIVRDAKRVPMLVLCVARFDLLDERPDWGGGLGDSLNLYLEPMAMEDATQLAREAGEGLDDATAERVAAHAGGNPFFIVETTGMLLHERADLPGGGDAIPAPLLPPTVQAVIAARIDHLAPAARDLVRKASVFSRSTFSTSDLALIADADPDVLAILEDEELLVHAEDDGDHTWRFRHGLVRDVAYESLPKRERMRLHLGVADELAKDEQRAARYPRALAYHLEQAARASLDLDPSDRSLAERAVEALARAGGLAMEASQARAAADLYERALALAGPDRDWGMREAAMLANLGEARYWLGEFEAAVGPLERALDLGAADTRTVAQAARFLGDIALSIRGERAGAQRYLDRAIDAARALGDPRTLARTLLVAGWSPYWAGDLDGARAMFEEALEVARSSSIGDPWAEARALVTLGNVISEIGDEEETLALASRALAIAEATGDAFSIATARESVGNSLRRRGRFEEAEPHLDKAVASFRELGARWELASALTSRGIARRLLHRLDDAIKDLKEAYRICRDLKERSIVTWTAWALARALSDAGEIVAARQVVEETATHVRSGDAAQTLGWMLEAETAILLAEGDRDGALEHACRALDGVRARGRSKEIAAQEWMVASVFGTEAVGGPEAVDAARAMLERTHWEQALMEPELLARRERAPAAR